jgi:hypothetical protein
MSQTLQTEQAEPRRPFEPKTLFDLIVSVMMACVIFIVVSVTTRINQNWHSQYLVVVAFVITLLAMFSTRFTRDYTTFSREWVLHFSAEWIAILVALKVIIYMVNDPAQFFKDLPLWQKDFIYSFFTIEYVLSIGVAVLCYAIAAFFSDKFQRLENDPNLLEQERQGYLVVNRAQARTALMAMIFTLGGVMLILTTINSAPLDFLAPSAVPVKIDVAVLLLFFFLGLVLLSQSQYSILNAHWYIESIPSSPKISRFWFPASLVILGVVALVAIFLPTRYSLGLLDLIRSLVNLLLILLTILQAVILAPLIALLTLFARLLRLTDTASQTTQETPKFTPEEQVTTVPIPWLELVQSIIFWVIFFGIIIFALRYYINQHPGMFKFLTKLGIGVKFRQFWNWIKSGMRRVNQGVSSLVSSGLEKLRALQSRKTTNFKPFAFISRNLPPRTRIILSYLAMVHFNSQYGILRKKAQTPYEYAAMVEAVGADINQDLEKITSSFVEARYTRHSITIDQASAVQTALENLQKNLKAFFEQEQ